MKIPLDISTAIESLKGITHVFKENKENRKQRAHVEAIVDADLDLATLQQFAKEFHARSNRTWWDAFVDGLNRLPRPLLTLSVMSIFVLAPMSPERFIEVARSYEVIPPGYWALLSIVVSFYFGGRMQIKKQDMTLKEDALQAAKDLIAMREDFRSVNTEPESIEEKIYEAEVTRSGGRLENAVVSAWLARKSKGRSEEVEEA